MRRHYLVGIKDRIAFTVFLLGAPIDLLYEYHVTSFYSKTSPDHQRYILLYYGKKEDLLIVKSGD